MREWSDSWPLLLALSTYFHSAFLLRLLKMPPFVPFRRVGCPGCFGYATISFDNSGFSWAPHGMPCSCRLTLSIIRFLDDQGVPLRRYESPVRERQEQEVLGGH